MVNIAISKFICFETLITLLYFSEIPEAIQWRFDYNSSHPNFSLPYGTRNCSEDQKRMFRLDGQTDRRITSALSETLKNVALAAGQPVPVLTWKQDPTQDAGVKFGLQSNLQNPADIKAPVQRSVRDSDSASKVAAKQAELQQLLQQLYQAEATVQMEVGEVTRSQQIATEAAQMLEEATNKVRMLSSDLQAAQENAATCAMRAHTAQLQLAAHDQLMFTARQRVDALSAQMVSVQAELASVQNTFTLNESSQHLEQQGRLNNIYQFQPGANGNSPDPASAAAAAAAAGLLILPPGQEQQGNPYSMYRSDQLNLPQK